MAKYFAAGFLPDAEKLLLDFVKENSFDFSAFAQTWKKHNFAAIFMGRDEYQIAPFTNEIFQLTLGFLLNTNFLYQVGVTYLLYALFRHQIYKPQVMIRITLPQFEIIKKVQAEAIKHHFKTLQYVTDYLLKHAFDFVALPTLFGPNTSRTKIDYNNPTFLSTSLVKEMKSDMNQFQNSKVLENLRDLSSKYATVKEKVFPQAGPSTLHDYEEHIEQLRNLVSDGPMKLMKYNTKSDSSIGARRMALKNRTFRNRALFRQLNDVDEEAVDSEVQFGTKIKRKRVPKEERRVGRPRKSTLDEDPVESVEVDDSPTAEISGEKQRKGKRKKMTFIDNYEIESILEPITLAQSEKMHPESESESEEEEYDNHDSDVEDPTYNCDEELEFH